MVIVRFRSIESPRPLPHPPDRMKAYAGIDEVVQASRILAQEASALVFSAPVHTTYNPLTYAWAVHRQYVERFAAGTKRALFVGMNPGPWGMSQVGVPFGDVRMVRDWMGLSGQITRPEIEHAKRPIEGFQCRRSEVSGTRLWGLFATRFGLAERFFAEFFVASYCPLAFLASSGANITPDKLPRSETAALFTACDKALATLIAHQQPEWLIAIGAFAEKRLRKLYPGVEKLIRIPHPSPASPAANHDWAEKVTAVLEANGVWLPQHVPPAG